MSDPSPPATAGTRAVAWCSLGGGPPVPLVHGDVIGRLRTAALVVDDPRMSEGHALVSLRAGRLRLLGLRGRFRVHHRVTSDVELEPGLEIELAKGLVLRVDDVSLPDRLLAIEGDGLPRHVLSGPLALDARPVPRLRPEWHPDADAVLWNLDEAWRVSVHGGPARALAEGDRVDIAGWTLRVVAVDLTEASGPRTRREFTAALHLEACVDTVRIVAEGSPPVVVGGLPGRVLAELVALAGPVAWSVVAGEVWNDTDPARLRRRWDVTLGRLRERLRALGLRDDLVHTDGAGHVELLLRAGDTARQVDG